MSEEEDRRRQEINLFAAMALGMDVAQTGSEDPSMSGESNLLNQSVLRIFNDSNEGSVVVDSGTLVRPPELRSELSAEASKAVGDNRPSSMEDPLISLQPAESAGVGDVAAGVGLGGADDTGTFQFDSGVSLHAASATSASAAAERSNLEAAAASLSVGDGSSADPQHPAPLLSSLPATAMPMPQARPALVHQHAAPTVVHSAAAAQQQAADDNAPMFAEEVVMPRPLFFGAIVPPRVLRDGRKMVLQAMEELGLERYDSVSLQELPDSVRNLVGALRTYGYGLDDLFTDDLDDDNSHAPRCRGDPCVSTYQPVWGESERADRIREYQRHVIERPHPITRSSTAPPRLMAAFASGKNCGSWDVGSSASSSLPPNRASDGATTSSTSLPKRSTRSTASDSLASANSQFSMWIREDDGGSDEEDRSSEDSLVFKASASSDREDSPLDQQPLSEQELFSRWARRSDEIRHGTFQRLPVPGRGGDSSDRDSDDDDDDSVNYDELKKQVGISDHLSKAIASLADDDANQPPDFITLEETKSLLVMAPPADLRTRPPTNYELTNGCVPLFGYDDPPLPIEADLGVHETKEEVQRSNEQKRSQEIIEKLVAPNVFGCVACPNPALNPDDCHSWNSRSPTSQRALISGTYATSDMGTMSSLRRQGGSLDSIGVLSTTASVLQTKPKGKVPGSVSRIRYGWWNIEDKTKNDKPRAGKALEANDTRDLDKPLVLPPVQRSYTARQVVTSLNPTPENLREANLPLSRMHAATSMAQTLPYLSDRPPSHRYLQIDTQAVGFRPLGAEIEPLFCSLAIYNVETVSGDESHVTTAVPDLQRCGRVTEALSFDIVSDAEVSRRCSDSLWPYARDSRQLDDVSEGRLQGTRCGVFPVPSNLSVSNLYAVLIVRKVLSDPGELDAYVKPGYSTSDLEKLRVRAEKSSRRYGKFLVPFAFGVAPLLQVFGADDRTSAASKAVQIPLFRLLGGERSIIDHIMVMLYPRADHSASGIGGPAAVTNGGTAMLVMRNFGYLGLHSVVDKKSSLARDRLVDFTGELQLRARDHSDTEATEERYREPYRLKLPDWQTGFVSEPTVRGGRNCVDDEPREISAQSHLYAQEVAPIPLQLTPSTSRVPSSTVKPGGRLQGDDIEPFYHMSFCNELLFHPRLLHHCPKGNIVIKVELREMEWQQDFNAYFAHLPRAGPRIHNFRRGPFLVQSAFTSCSTGDDHQFVDEFKVKLPLDLRPRQQDGSSRTLSLFFTVYSIKVGSNSKLHRLKKLLGTIGSGSNDGTEQDGRAKSRLEQVACGFLPLTQHVSLVENGAHDVRIVYSARTPPAEFCSRGLASPSTLILVDGTRAADPQNAAAIGESFADDVNLSTTDSVSDLLTGSETGGRSDGTFSDLVSILEDSQTKTKLTARTEPMSLTVRIVVHSSLHTQSETLSTFLNEELDIPRLFHLPSHSFMSKIRAGKESLSGIDFQLSVNVRPVENQLLDLVIDISKHQLCSVPQSSSHLWRIMSLLWRLMIVGSGEPDLVWANPSSQLPLRVHAFATIIHLIGSTSMYLSKNGVTLVDGINGWNVVTLGRVISLVFDEKKLFGEQSIEVVDDDMWFPSDGSNSASSAASTERRILKRRHVRQTYDLFNDMPPRDTAETSDIISSQAGALHSPSRSLRPPHQKKGESHEVAVTKAPWLDEATTTDSEPRTAHRTVKVDSKSDFQSALRAAASEEDPDGFEGDGTRAARAMVQAFGGLQSGSKRFLTAPNRALSTIREAADNEDNEDHDGPAIDDDSRVTTSTLETVPISADTENGDSVVSTVKKAVKQFRVPNRGKQNPSETAEIKDVTSVKRAVETESMPRTDDEIETAGTAFLDIIGKSLGLSSTMEPLAGEERRVGSQHHRKNHSRGTSIDWSLLSEAAQNHSNTSGTTAVPKKNENGKDNGDENMSTLKTEETTCLRLPTFIDRLSLMAKRSFKTARWCPYAYEVVIMQWCAILIAQRRSNDKPATGPGNSNGTRAGDLVPENEVLAHAAVRSIGVAVASAPMLFEVIKQSLGFRILSLFRAAAARSCKRKFPPLVALDESLLLNLEQVISMVTDACLDARNFDSWELRQLSIDVNDSIVRFLRDMFSFLAPTCVHRLILIYLARFVTKEGKQWQDRDSSIGLRCSWEIAKMRVNAMTSFVRFADFTRVNSPQMMNWKDWMGSGPRLAPPGFFDAVLDQYSAFRLASFVGGDETDRKATLDIPKMRPHWLSELVIDVCLLGTVHAEQYIQQRSASLLYEVFWQSAQYGKLKCRSAPIGSMFVTFLEKILGNLNYLSNFGPKSQLRKDLLPCAIFVLEAAPGNLLRALWRRLIKRLGGKCDAQTDSTQLSRQVEGIEENDIIDVFTLLNLSLKTMEYEGSEESLDPDNAADGRESVELWTKEYLLARTPMERRKWSLEISHCVQQESYVSSISRKWEAHDCSLVIVSTAHHIVLEMHSKLSSSAEGRSMLNPAVRRNRSVAKGRDSDTSLGVLVNGQRLGYDEVVHFLRAATSVYLQALALRQSDIVVVRTFRVTAEAIKIFGIRMFLLSIGETLQHWMRVIFINCGARRAQVRVEATDLLELLLRSTWECFGSFFRIRVPLLAVQTEVMERIVATAAARYYRDQRRLGTTFERFSHLNAEASLVPLWRTLDRIEKQPASQNVAFRGALVRMAGKLKKVYKAYIAARVLSFIQGNADETQAAEESDLQTESLVRARRINVMRVINASQGYSKQFVGFQGTGLVSGTVAHYEAVEDALLDAADIFSATELPEHRVAWLRMLADVHRTRRKFAEEATCHFYIHTTLQQASRLHGSLWSNTPFLPWTDNIPDPVYICDWENPNTDPDYEPEFDLDSHDGNFGRQVESANSFRRIFYRVANSVGVPNDEWDINSTNTLFCGVTYAYEYHTVNPWITLREMEEQMVEEAESGAELFLQAGIVQSSRFAWTLATSYYSEKFNFAKLAIAYGNLSRTIVTQVPPIDTSLPQEFSAVFGRYYRVWFHGGAPDDLTGLEFVYRTEGSVFLDQFGDDLRNVIQSIIPDKTPINLLLDGRPEERGDDTTLNFGFSRIGSAPLEPVRIKVTPLRPLSRNASRIRGRPEWFVRYVEEAFAERRHRTRNDLNVRATQRRAGSIQMESSIDGHQRDHFRTFSATAFSSGSSGVLPSNHRRRGSAHFNHNNRVIRADASSQQELAGVDKFCFVQPKDRKRTSREWWKSQAGDFAEKTLKVTQLQVSQPFPACVARQEVIHRVVYGQSPLEAGVDAICQWCAVLFRTAVATVGQALLGEASDPGIGTDAAKVVADCVHSSNVKEMALALLEKNSGFAEGDSSTEFSLDYDRLTEDEVKKLRVKISRLVIVFLELLHLLIARNRDILLDIIQERKKSPGQDNPPAPASASSQHGGYSRSTSVGLGDFRPAPVLPYSQSLHGGEQGRDTPTLSLRDGRGRDTISGMTAVATLTQPLPNAPAGTLLTPSIAAASATAGSQITVSSPLFESAQRRVRSVSDAGLRGTGSTTGPLSAMSAHASSLGLQPPRRSGACRSGDESVVSISTRTDSAIAVQSELQRAFISLCKALHPRVLATLQDDTPRWLKQCCQDNYFSLGTYKLTKIPIGEEMCFNTSASSSASPSPEESNLPPQSGVEASPYLNGGGGVAGGGGGGGVGFAQESNVQYPRAPSEIDSIMNESVAGESAHSQLSKGSAPYSSSQRLVATAER